jgi:hypothetical protein
MVRLRAKARMFFAQFLELEQEGSRADLVRRLRVRLAE